MLPAGSNVTLSSWTAQAVSFAVPNTTQGPTAMVTVAAPSGLGGFQCPSSTAELLILVTVSHVEQVRLHQLLLLLPEYRNAIAGADCSNAKGITCTALRQ